MPGGLVGITTAPSPSSAGLPPGGGGGGGTAGEDAAGPLVWLAPDGGLALHDGRGRLLQVSSLNQSLNHQNNEWRFNLPGQALSVMIGKLSVSVSVLLEQLHVPPLDASDAARRRLAWARVASEQRHGVLLPPHVREAVADR
jgi:hypothetical protein